MKTNSNLFHSLIKKATVVLVSALSLATVKAQGNFQNGVQYSKTNNSSSEITEDMDVESASGLTVKVGTFSKTFGYGTNSITGNAYNNGFIIASDPAGNYQWHYTFLASNSTSFVKVKSVKIGKYYDGNTVIVVAGYFGGTITHNGNSESDADKDIFYAVFNTAGNLIAFKRSNGVITYDINVNDVLITDVVNGTNGIFILGEYDDAVNVNGSSGNMNITSYTGSGLFVCRAAHSSSGSFWSHLFDATPNSTVSGSYLIGKGLAKIGGSNNTCVIAGYYFGSANFPDVNQGNITLTANGHSAGLIERTNAFIAACLAINTSTTGYFTDAKSFGKAGSNSGKNYGSAFNDLAVSVTSAYYAGGKYYNTTNGNEDFVIVRYVLNSGILTFSDQISGDGGYRDNLTGIGAATSGDAVFYTGFSTGFTNTNVSIGSSSVVNPYQSNNVIIAGSVEYKSSVLTARRDMQIIHGNTSGDMATIYSSKVTHSGCGASVCASYYGGNLVTGDRSYLFSKETTGNYYNSLHTSYAFEKIDFKYNNSSIYNIDITAGQTLFIALSGSTGGAYSVFARLLQSGSSAFLSSATIVTINSVKYLKLVCNNTPPTSNGPHYTNVLVTGTVNGCKIQTTLVVRLPYCNPNWSFSFAQGPVNTPNTSVTVTNPAQITGTGAGSLDYVLEFYDPNTNAWVIYGQGQTVNVYCAGTFRFGARSACYSNQAYTYTSSFTVSGNSLTPAIDCMQSPAQLSTPTIAKQNLTVMPNPASNVIQLAHNRPLQKIIITDNTGKIVKELNNISAHASIDISNLSAGMHFGKVLDTEGKEFHIKFIKQ